MTRQLIKTLIFLFVFGLGLAPLAWAESSADLSANDQKQDSAWFNPQAQTSPTLSLDQPPRPFNFNDQNKSFWQADKNSNQTKTLNFNLDSPALNSLSIGLKQERTLITPAGLELTKPETPEPQPRLGFSGQENTLASSLVGTKTIFNDRLLISSGFDWQRRLYQGFWTQALNSRPLNGYDTMTFGFGADWMLNSDLSLGASLISRDSTRLAGFDRQGPEGSFIYPYRSAPLSLKMSRAGFNFYRPQWGTMVNLTGYGGTISSVSDPGPAQLERRVDLRGLEFKLQQSLFSGRLNLEAASMFNYLKSKDPLLRSSRNYNLSGYLGLDYRNPSLVNFSLLFRYAQDGKFVNKDFYGQFGAEKLIDAKIWHDFSLSPVLTLSTQIYGSSLIEAYYQSINNKAPLGPYLEGSVTMSYSF
jgi:hypothetical protein